MRIMKLSTADAAIISKLSKDKANARAIHNLILAKQTASLASQKTTAEQPYYSRARFNFATATDAASPPNTTYSLSKGTAVRAFTYAIGTPMDSVGYPGRVATENDTNLVQAGQTKGGAKVEIYAIGAMLAPLADAELTRLLFDACSVQLSLNGQDNSFNLGPLPFLPGGGGLYGNGDAPSIPSQVGGGQSRSSVLTNGYPSHLDVMPLSKPLTWDKAGESDSNLSVTVTVQQNISLVSTARAAAAGVLAYTPPTGVGTRGTFVDFWLRLYVRSTAPRSKNA